MKKWFYRSPQPSLFLKVDDAGNLIDAELSEPIEIDNRTMLERNIASFRQVREAHQSLIEELDMQIAERHDERRQALATVAMCDAALATVEPIE